MNPETGPETLTSQFCQPYYFMKTLKTRSTRGKAVFKLLQRGVGGFLTSRFVVNPYLKNLSYKRNLKICRLVAYVEALPFASELSPGMRVAILYRRRPTMQNKAKARPMTRPSCVVAVLCDGD